MSHKFKLLFLIATIVLIPILLGTTPINLFQKLSTPCPCSPDKQIHRVSSCLFNSIVSQDDFNAVTLNSYLRKPEPNPSFQIETRNSTQPYISLVPIPLRCWFFVGST